MAIFGINFGDLGSRKLRFDSQKNNINFNGLIKDTIPEKSIKKYAVSKQPLQIPSNEKPIDDAPTIKYGIPSENFRPYVNINPPKPSPEPPIVKYGFPPEK